MLVEVKSWIYKSNHVNKVNVEISEDRQSIRIRGEFLEYKPTPKVDFETHTVNFDLTFNVGDHIYGRPYDRGGWVGRILKITEKKITLEGRYDRNQHVSLEDFIARNYFGKYDEAN